MSRQIALSLQTQDGGERRGWRGVYKGGRDGYKRSDWTNTAVPGSDSDSFMFVVGLVVGGKITEMLGLVLADRNLNLRFLTARFQDAEVVRFELSMDMMTGAL